MRGRKRVTDLAGRTFGEWTVTSVYRTRRDKGGRSTRAEWLVLCSCGAAAWTLACNLVRGSSRGCAQCRHVRHTAAPSRERLAAVMAVLVALRDESQRERCEVRPLRGAG